MSFPNNLWKRAHDDWTDDEDFWKCARFDIISEYKNPRKRVGLVSNVSKNFVIVWLKNKLLNIDGSSHSPCRYTHDYQDKLGFVGHVSDEGLINIHYIHNGHHYIIRDVDPKKQLFMDICTGPSPKDLPMPPNNWVTTKP